MLGLANNRMYNGMPRAGFVAPHHVQCKVSFGSKRTLRTPHFWRRSLMQLTKCLLPESM
jgi:hypothetical protein